ncbi:arsenic resistance protein [bacterium]|nr:arsenic resistance protein [bacterium]
MTEKIQSLSKFLQKWMPVLVLVVILSALLFGYFYHQKTLWLKNIILPAMIVMLIPMMMGLVVEELKLMAKDKKVLFLATLINFILSPLLAFVWAKLFFYNLDPKFIAGWILKLTMPCAAMVVAWTGLAKGKTETALVIQVVSFILAVIFVPFWMTILVHSYITIPAFFIVKKIFFIIVVPMAIGVSLRELLIKKIGQEDFKKEVKPFLPSLSTLGMYVVIFSAISQEAKSIFENLHLIWILFLSILIVYPSLFIFSIFLSRKFKIKYENAIALGYSTTAKNHGITLALAFSVFGGLSILPAAFTPILQIPLMMIIYHLSPKIKIYFSDKN